MRLRRARASLFLVVAAAVACSSSSGGGHASSDGGKPSGDGGGSRSDGAGGASHDGGGGRRRDGGGAIDSTTREDGGKPRPDGASAGQKVTPGNGCGAALGIDSGFYTCTKEYFVSPTGSDDNSGTSATEAVKTIGKATSLPLVGGDCVTVADGTYDETVVIGTSGSADTCSGYVVFRAASPGGANIVSTDEYTGVTVAASYVMVDGFDMQDTGTGSAFGAGTNTLSNGHVIVYHHIAAIHDIAHDSGGAGLGAIHADYIRFEANVVYNNSSRSDYGDSGIDLWEAQASDDLPGFHIVIRNNYSYGNIESGIPASLQTDGEGIIVDSFDYADLTYGSTPYAQDTLIENNVVWGNGGRGIEAAGGEPTSHVTIRNNTVFDNNRQLQQYPGAEIVSYGNDNAIYDNIVILGPDDQNGSDGDQTYPLLDNCGTSGGGVVIAGGSTWENNIVYNMKSPTALSYTSCISGMNSIPTGDNLMGKDPGLAAEKLSSPATPTLSDLTIDTASPATHAGTTASYAPFDYDYVLRPSPPSIGAFEP
jgi:hypothetical protein